jgi:hypothetical protein
MLYLTSMSVFMCVRMYGCAFICVVDGRNKNDYSDVQSGRHEAGSVQNMRKSVQVER